VLFVALFACSQDPPPASDEPTQLAETSDSAITPSESNPGFREYSIDAKLDTDEMMREDLAAERHASDGGGRAWLASVTRADGQPGPLRSEDFGRFEIVYQAGPLGIELGGELQLMVSPFWRWDPPQNLQPDQRGYTEVRTDADGVELLPVWHGNELLAIGIGGRKLVAGERVEIVYGAGPEGARVDVFAERGERLWIAVDGNADGIRRFIADSPKFDIAARDPAHLVIGLPTTLRPGDSFDVFVSILDRHGNAGFPFTGHVEIDVPEGLELPNKIDFTPEHAGRRRIRGSARAEGIYRMSARAFQDGAEPTQPIFAKTGPIVVEDGIARVRWADLHGHSQLSDGTGTPGDYFTYAREVAALDIVSLTDHDHWGIQFLDKDPALWETIKRTVVEHHAPGSFITLLGYEWTSWLHGHRHVLYFEDDGEVYSSMDPRYRNPRQLWDALNGQNALTFAHHSAGGPVSTNWSFPPDPVLEPITEVVSVHGSSEAFDSPGAIYNPVQNNFVRDVLVAGYRMGFVGSGDGHDGHPGLAQIANNGGGGLAAIFVEDLDRDSVLEAMRARHTYATNGVRNFVEVSIDGHPMGSFLPAATQDDGPTQTLKIRVIGESRLERIDLIRSGMLSSVELANQTEWSIESEIPRLQPGEFHYVRVIEQTGAAAWTSPIFAD